MFSEPDRRPGSVWQLLMALNECGLKNDAMLDVFYEEFGQRHQTDKSYAIYFFHGSYDVPLKASEGELVGIGRGLPVSGLCSLSGERRLQAGEPECSFLFPAF